MKFEQIGKLDILHQSIEEFTVLKPPKNMREDGYSEHIFIELDITHKLSKKSEIQEYKGLVNEGMTCYLNSLIQTLFFLRAFRNAVYQMPSKE